MEVILTEQSTIGVFNYITDTTPLVGKPHFLPKSQCPSCFDIGQDVYASDSGWILVCPYCKVQYKIEFRRTDGSLYPD